MIRIIAKLFAVAVGFTVCLPVQPSSAGGVAFVSATGGGSACTQTAPCGTIIQAIIALPSGTGQIVCITPVEQTAALVFSSTTIDFDCPSTTWDLSLTFAGSGAHTFHHIHFNGLNSAGIVYTVTGGGTVIFDDCVFEDIVGIALDIEPSGPLNLVITNSRILNNGSGVLIKPAAGGSVTATFNGVTIVNNNGGGLKIDTTNGPVTADISNSTITKNAGNGINAVSGASAQNNMLNISHTVIAKNGSAGVQANGANSAALIDTTLLDSNTVATSAINGGRILTYGNNRMVGTAGSGFTGSAPLN